MAGSTLLVALFGEGSDDAKGGASKMVEEDSGDDEDEKGDEEEEEEATDAPGKSSGDRGRNGNGTDKATKGQLQGCDVHWPATAQPLRQALYGLLRDRGLQLSAVEEATGKGRAGRPTGSEAGF